MSVGLFPTEPHFLNAEKTKTAKFNYLVINISSKEDWAPFASVHFSPFLNSKKEASALLSHIHSISQKKSGMDNFDAFTRKNGKPIFNYFVDRFKKAFPGKTRILAVNPSRHSYHYPNETVIWLQLKDKGIVSKDEEIAFKTYLKDPEHSKFGVFGVSIIRLKEIGKLFQEQKQWIISRSVGIHKSVFKKAGFKPEKSKRMFWRLK